MMQKLFSQEIRFRDEDGNDFPDWTYGALSEFLNERNDQVTRIGGLSADGLYGWKGSCAKR